MGYGGYQAFMRIAMDLLSILIPLSNLTCCQQQSAGCSAELDDNYETRSRGFLLFYIDLTDKIALIKRIILIFVLNHVVESASIRTSLLLVVSK